MSNLLTIQEINKNKLLYRKRFIVVSLMCLIILMVVSIVFVIFLNFYSKKEESVLLEKKSAYEKMEVGKLKHDLVLTINDINKRLNSFDEKRVSSPLVASFIDPILNAKTDSISLLDFDYSLVPNSKTARVNISGISSNRESILIFADNLRKTPNITGVDVPITNFIKESNMPFSISIVVGLK